MKIKKFFLYFTIILSILSFGSLSQAGDYPDRPISVVVAYNPGGATDFQARLVTMMAAHPKKDYLGQPIVIINKPGAGGKVGWNWFASKARNDGYDLAAYNVPHFISQSIVFDDTKYNIDNLEPIANWGADPAVLIVGPDSPFNSVADLLKFAKANLAPSIFAFLKLVLLRSALSKTASCRFKLSKFLPDKSAPTAYTTLVSAESKLLWITEYVFPKIGEITENTFSAIILLPKHPIYGFMFYQR